MPVRFALLKTENAMYLVLDSLNKIHDREAINIGQTPVLHEFGHYLGLNHIGRDHETHPKHYFYALYTVQAIAGMSGATSVAGSKKVLAIQIAGHVVIPASIFCTGPANASFGMKYLAACSIALNGLLIYIGSFGGTVIVVYLIRMTKKVKA